MLHVRFFYLIGANYHVSSMIIQNTANIYTEIDIKKAICDHLQVTMNRSFCVYDIELIHVSNLNQVA